MCLWQRIPTRVRNSRTRCIAILSIPLITLIGISACGLSKAQLRLGRAMYMVRSEIRPDYRDGMAILEQYRNDEKHKNAFVQHGMCEMTHATLGGNVQLADKVGKHVHLAVKRYQDADSETRAAMGNEAIKFFKGEPHERALLCFYTGLTCYLNGEYNDARVFFMQSLLASATRDEDMAEFRDDFRLGHFWLGRAYLKLGDEGNARVAFGRAGTRLLLKNENADIKKRQAERKKALDEELKGEALCYKQRSAGKQAVEGLLDLSKTVRRLEMPITLPDAAAEDQTEEWADVGELFLDPEFQKRINLIIVVELGRGPIKYLHGSSGSQDDFLRVEYKERAVDVYVDGRFSGPAFDLMDTYHQAITRGVKTRRGRQGGKAATKWILQQLPGIGTVADHWDIQADARYWTTLPGEVHVYGARVRPGLHDIAMKFHDINDYYLPRFDVSRHYINVPEEGETVLLLHSVENQENAFMLTRAP